MSKKVSLICSYIENNAMITDGMISGVSASKLSGALPALDGSNLTGVTGSGISNLVEDTSPQLGGTLDWNI